MYTIISSISVNITYLASALVDVVCSFDLFGCFVWSCILLVLFSLLARSTDQDKDLDAEGVYQSRVHAEVVYQLLVHMTTSSKSSEELMAMAKHRVPLSLEFSSIWEEVGCNSPDTL